MKIVDAQVHIWSTGTPLPPHRSVSSFTAEELLKEMDEAGVDAAVIHPPTGWNPTANEVAIDAARRHPKRLSILGQFPPDKPESRSLIAGWTKHPGMLGMRWPLLAPNQQTWHVDGTMDWVWDSAERAGLPIALMAGRFLPDLRRIAECHPKLKLIVDHFGLVQRAQDDAAFVRLDQLLPLAKLPNVALKATGAPSYSSQPYPFRNIHDGIHRIYDAFGPDRFFWGTDITRMSCSYRQCVTMFTEELPWLKGRDLELVMGRGVCNWLGWNAPFEG